MTIEPPISLSNHYLEQIFDLLAARQVDPERICSELGIVVERNAKQTNMPWVSFYRLMSLASGMFREHSFGLLLGERLLINMHGPLGIAALSTGSLRELLALLEQYLSLRTDLLTLSVVERGDDVLLSFHECRPLRDIRAPVSEAVVLAVRNLMDFATLASTGIQEACFPFSGDAVFAKEIFRCPVQYDAHWCGLRLDASHLDTRLKMAHASSYREALRVCQDELEKLGNALSLATQVRRLLLKSRQGFPALEVVARHLNLTPRTLHRHLLREATSYQAELDAVRHALAKRYLAQHMPVQEIAYVLGYTEQANFRRAFIVDLSKFG